ncbi:hypothetical protein [Streptomyces sp. NBC_01443]|uniref:hypothetical protein n=1 Tax=Streptomyces sp. NBC_01443 TaxID=2903868 RepID=UPI002256685F|nr:hypothetical protein [Streptomyces sp. NBC_01443]MCX4632410.1 hypothetical protein [Streptomyces sp. NBC_01443]
MVSILPLTLPASVVDGHRVDLTARPSDGWGFRAHDAVANAAGETYVLCAAVRYRPQDVASHDPFRQNFTYHLIIRYDVDGTPTATALLGGPTPGNVPTGLTEGSDFDLAVLPDGTVAVSSKPGNTHLFSASLDCLVESWRSPWRWTGETERTGDPFAVSVDVTPSGRLLCATAEYGVSNRAGRVTNLVSLSEPGSTLGPGAKATLRAIATHDARTDRQTAADRNPHVVFDGAPVGGANRPSPSLTEMVSTDDRARYDYADCRMGRPAAMGDDLFVVPVFGRTYRSGSRGQVFSFLLLDGQGAARGKLEGMHRYEDSPFTGLCYTVAGDAYRARAFHLNRYGLYAWDAEGRMRARIPTGDAPFKALTHFALMDCTPAGELLLVHHKQHLLLRVPVPEDLGDLEDAVRAALKGYGPARNALKRQYAPVNWHWVAGAAPVHRF